MKKLFLVFVLVLFTAQFSQAQWMPEVRLTNDPGSSWSPVSNSRPVATSGDSVHVVWYDDRDGNYEIYYKRSIDGGISWGEDTRLTNAINISYDPSLAVSGSVVHVVWSDKRDGSTKVEIYYKRSEDGGSTWGVDTRLTFADSWSESPSIAIEDSVIHLVWYDYRNATGDWDYEIYYKRSTDGGLTWESDVRLTDNPSYSGFPCVAVSGQIVNVVWEDDRDGTGYEGSVYCKRSADGGATWGSDTRLTDDIADAWDPVIAVSGSDVHVVWHDMRDGSFREIYYKRSTDGGTTWGDDTRLTDAFESSEWPNIAVSGSIVHVVWGDKRDMNFEIYYKRSDNAGLTWEEDTRLTDAFGDSNWPFVASADSSVHVIWNESKDGNKEIYYKRNPSGNIIVGIENELPVNSSLVVSIYPNPASKILNISFKSPSGEAITLRFMDMSGKILKTTNFHAAVGVNQYTITLEDFSNGLYYIELTMESNRIFRKVIIHK